MSQKSILNNKKLLGTSVSNSFLLLLVRHLLLWHLLLLAWHLFRNVSEVHLEYYLLFMSCITYLACSRVGACANTRNPSVIIIESSTKGSQVDGVALTLSGSSTGSKEKRV